MYTNADCLISKFATFKERIADEKPQIISIVETALQGNEVGKKYCPDEFLAIDGYQMFRQDNTFERKGGILVYVKDDILVSSNKMIDNLASDFKESLWLELQHCEEKIMFGTVYRKGKSGARNNKKLLEIITKVSRVYKKVVICGDFNFPEIDWITGQVNAGPMSAESQFVDCLFDCYLEQYVEHPTRRRGTDEPSLIDLIITENSQHLADSIKHSMPFGKSDHDVLTWDYLVTVKEEDKTDKNTEEKVRYNVNKGNYEGLNSVLKCINWDEELKDIPLDESVEKFYSIVNDAIKDWVPVMGNKEFKRDKPPWMSKSARKEIKNKRCAWKRYTESKTYANYLSYTKIRNKTCKAIKQAKKSFEKKLASECKSNPKAFYKYANFKSKSNKKVIRLRDKHGKVQLKDEANAEILNDYFTSVFTKEKDADALIMNAATNMLFDEPAEDPFNYNGKTAKDNIDISSIVCDEETVEGYLRNIDSTKSNISECVHPRILKECATSLAKPISIIYRQSLETGSVPSAWKKGSVTPLHKTGSRHDACNYRPVTITSILCRVLEKIIKRSVVDHLENINFISNEQHGFREKRSCLTNLLMNMEEITKLLDEGNMVDQIYLDFQKAFDKVPHQRLVYKLKKAGITGTLLCWIESFLTKRKQRVKINGKYSSWSDVISGVPQGSVLGPLLFILFINDLPDCLNSCSCKIFADDTKIARSANNLEDVELIQQDLEQLYEWTTEWQLKFNAKKCHVIHFGRKNPHSLYHLNGTLINEVSQEKDLGIVVSDNLTAHKNVLECVKKANKTLGMIKRTFSYLNETMLAQLIKVFIRPHLEYCQQAISPTMKKDSNLIESVLRRATRLIPQLEQLDYDERLKRLNLYSMEDRILRGDLILMFRIMTDNILLSKNELFTLSNSNTRGHRLKVSVTERFRTDTRKMFFTKRVIVPWNSLPEHVLNSLTVNEFKAKYDKWLGKVV